MKLWGFFSFVISVKFRSLVPNGVLLYAANDLQMPTHFISLELVNGRLVFKYNAGFKTVKVLSTFNNYSDGGYFYTVKKKTLFRVVRLTSLTKKLHRLCSHDLTWYVCSNAQEKEYTLKLSLRNSSHRWTSPIRRHKLIQTHRAYLYWTLAW